MDRLAKLEGKTQEELQQSLIEREFDEIVQNVENASKEETRIKAILGKYFFGDKHNTLKGRTDSLRRYLTAEQKVEIRRALRQSERNINKFIDSIYKKIKRKDIKHNPNGAYILEHPHDEDHHKITQELAEIEKQFKLPEVSPGCSSALYFAGSVAAAGAKSIGSQILSSFWRQPAEQPTNAISSSPVECDEVNNQSPAQKI